MGKLVSEEHSISGNLHEPYCWVLPCNGESEIYNRNTHKERKKVKSLSHVRLFANPWTVCSPPGSSIHGIFQARTLEWVAISFSRGSSWPMDQTRVSHIAGRCFTIWASREAHPQGNILSISSDKRTLQQKQLGSICKARQHLSAMAIKFWDLNSLQNSWQKEKKSGLDR